MKRVLLLRLFICGFASAACVTEALVIADSPPVTADVELTDKNYSVWRDHILPEAEELAWAKIPWLTTFKDGILKAQEQQRPVLLWTMNGHPLGCT